MSKKVGILTFHCVPNYGAILQAYAFKTFLQKTEKSDISIIDFQCKGNSLGFEPKRYLKSIADSKNPFKKIVKKTIVALLTKRSYTKKCAGFAQFAEEKLNIAQYDDKMYYTYDYLFCGSDQIWNCDITNGFQAPYFGANKPDDSVAVVSSYAASCGDIAEFNSEKKKKLFANVSKLDHVGVRESTLAEVLKKNGINAVATVDPTFLLTKENYIEDLELDTNKRGKPFILQYSLRKSSNLDEAAKKISKEKKLPIVKVCGYVRVIPEKGKFDVGPKEFLQLLLSSEYVVTNSFHGVALSLVFEKNFNSILPPSRKGRVTDLLQTIGCSNRIWDGNSELDLSDIDYGSISPVLNNCINQSKRYIESVFASEVNNGQRV